MANMRAHGPGTTLRLPAMSTLNGIPELSVVELRAPVPYASVTGAPLAGTVFPAGTQGTVVSSLPGVESYTVEVSDESGRTLALLDCHPDQLKVVWTPAITVNGHEMSYQLVHDLVEQVLWKQTTDVNLNTPEGCEEAATVIARFLAHLGRDGYHPTEQG